VVGIGHDEKGVSREVFVCQQLKGYALTPLFMIYMQMGILYH
jgi:hypothetical protein